MIPKGLFLARDLLAMSGRVALRATEPFMSIQPVFTNQRVSEAPAPRRRAEGGEGEAFALPERQDASSVATNKSADAKPAEEASAEASGAEAAAKPAAVEGKGEGVVKPGDVVAKSPAPPPADNRFDAAVSGTGIDFLIAMAAAQAEVAAVPGSEDKPKPDGKTASGEGDQPSSEAKADDGTAGAADPQPGVDQIKTGVGMPHPMPMLPLPVATAGADAAGDTQLADASTIVAGDRAKSQGLPLPLPGFAKAGAHSAGDGEAIAADDVKLVDGKMPPATGAHGEIKGAEDKLLAGAAPQADATAATPAGTDPKPLDSLQQALGPLDLSAMLQQGAGKPGHDRLVQPLDPNPMPGGAGNAPGQAAAGQPTPIHVVPIEIGLRAMTGAKQFDIRLDPGELGRVDVNLSISDKGEVSAKLVVDRVETLHLLQRDARTLERAFEQAGLKPSDGGVDISLRDPSDQSAFRQNRQHDETPQRPRSQQGAERAEETQPSNDPAPQRRLVRLGGVDLSI
ncbi:Flagellar hook-length control protein fliK [Hyphomicrobiales bacterium]|nr:Flagellar hook-length control protein fliK [Hyphomicrobiales bacterium]CAH1699663.1 Flagellar hook-length control protein fliK [Hyphomicrobiales bacterium]CAI0343394.1 flagellar hook-length control protein FliK [Hyphomicrobiales bacterium]